MRSIFAGEYALRVLECLDEPKTFSELLKVSGLKARELAFALRELREKGLVVKEGYWYRRWRV